MTTVTVEEALVAFLKNTGSVSALVGARVYKHPGPRQTEESYITWQRISGPRDYTLDGPSGLARPRFQLGYWGKTYADCKAVGDAVRGALNGFRGLLGDADSTINCKGAFLVDDRDIYDEDTRFEGLQADYEIWHDE